MRAERVQDLSLLREARSASTVPPRPRLVLHFNPLVLAPPSLADGSNSASFLVVLPERGIEREVHHVLKPAS